MMLKSRLNSNHCKICSQLYKNNYTKQIYIDLTPPVCSSECFYKLINDSASTTYTESEIKLLGEPFGNINKSIYDFRSILELKFIVALAKLYKAHNEYLPKIEYEPYSFRLSKNKSYVPDFLIHNALIFFEVKGLWERGARKKIELFVTSYLFKFYLIDREFISFINRGTW